MVDFPHRMWLAIHMTNTATAQHDINIFAVDEHGTASATGSLLASQILESDGLWTVTDHSDEWAWKCAWDCMSDNDIEIDNVYPFGFAAQWVLIDD